MTETAEIHGHHLKLGEFIYVINEYGKFLRKIEWIGPYQIEWCYGWANIDQLELNTDKKSKVKFILKEE